MLRRLACMGLALVGLVGCGAPARHQNVSVLPHKESSPDYPASEKLPVVQIAEAEWVDITKTRRASPCDRHAKFVAKDGLALLQEGLRALGASGRARISADCTQETVRLTVGERELDLDFLRASVARDAWGKAVRLHGFSARSGRLVRGLYHLEQPRDTDGIVIVNLQRYLPTEIGPVRYHVQEDREELFVTSKADDGKKGLFVVSRAWGADDDLELGVARYTVVKRVE